jgi:hypothetical protein
MQQRSLLFFEKELKQGVVDYKKVSVVCWSRTGNPKMTEEAVLKV